MHRGCVLTRVAGMSAACRVGVGIAIAMLLWSLLRHKPHKRMSTIAYWKQIGFDAVHEVVSDLHLTSDERFDLDSIRINANRVGVRLPVKYSVGVCTHAVLLHHHTRRHHSLECGPIHHYQKSNRFINKHLALAVDLSFGGFQHDIIAGLPVAAMLLHWVLQHPSDRAFLCSAIVCDILRHSVPPSSVIQLADDPAAYPLTALSLRIAFNEWSRENLTDLSYPVGAYSLARRVPVPLSTSRTHVLYLSRGGPGSSRYLDNEQAVIAALRKWCGGKHKTLLVMEHRNPPVWNVSEVRAAFRGASHVVGLHGGALANLVYCVQGARVVEINNEAQGDGQYWRRDYFATMALALGLRYDRLPTPFPMLYRDPANKRNHFTLSEDMLRALIALLEGMG